MHYAPYAKERIKSTPLYICALAQLGLSSTSRDRKDASDQNFPRLVSSITAQLCFFPSFLRLTMKGMGFPTKDHALLMIPWVTQHRSLLSKTNQRYMGVAFGTSQYYSSNSAQYNNRYPLFFELRDVRTLLIKLLPVKNLRIQSGDSNSWKACSIFLTSRRYVDRIRGI